MQEVHAIGGCGGRLFGGGGDRRLRPLNHPNHQALKCPRCDSLNTKFCYYNNYNLSQPRHYCKNCRRYWTKGGVLRNVPVGGGCRKTKRSKPKPSSDTSKERKSNSHSSSESSSLTASTTAATTTVATGEVVSGSSSTSASTIINCPESRFFVPQTTNPSFDPPVINPSSDGVIFPEIGIFTSMMASSVEPSVLGFNVAGISPFDSDNQRLKQQWHEEQKLCSSIGDELAMHEIAAGFVDDQTAEIEFPGSQNRTSNGGFTPVDWQAGVDQGLFDLTGTVDPSYWAHSTQWTDNDHHLNYLP